MPASLPGIDPPRRQPRASRRICSVKLKEIEREIIAGTFDPVRWFPWSRQAAVSNAATVETVGDFVGEYLQELVGVRERSREQYRLVFEAHVLQSKFARVPLTKLDDGQLKRLLRELESKRVAGRRLQPSTINKILARVRTALTLA